VLLLGYICECKVAVKNLLGIENFTGKITITMVPLKKKKRYHFIPLYLGTIVER
jgi:hypothetical protein